jgi:hypothetical protein
MNPSLSTWSVRHPIGVVMLTLAAMVLGAFALGSLNLDLLPRLEYPDIRVRVLNPGVPGSGHGGRGDPALEEQLAVTEGAVAIQSRTREGRSAVDLSFRYGEDIDRALRDASNRLDQAKRFLPDGIEPPVIYKRDPAQRPVAEYVISSTLRDPVELRDWVEYRLSRSLLDPARHRRRRGGRRSGAGDQSRRGPVPSRRPWAGHAGPARHPAGGEPRRARRAAVDVRRRDQRAHRRSVGDGGGDRGPAPAGDHRDDRREFGLGCG